MDDPILDDLVFFCNLFRPMMWIGYTIMTMNCVQFPDVCAMNISYVARWFSLYIAIAVIPMTIFILSHPRIFKDDIMYHILARLDEILQNNETFERFGIIIQVVVWILVEKFEIQSHSDLYYFIIGCCYLETLRILYLYMTCEITVNRYTFIDGKIHDMRSNTDTELKDHSCAICLSNYERHDNIELLKCQHVFHNECLQNWLAIHNTCPCCRSVINS